MIQASDSTPILSRPHTLHGRGRVRVLGAGELVLRLEGRSHVTIRRGPHDRVRFAGAGRLRHLASDKLQICGAHGELRLEGAQLDVLLEGGSIRVAVVGRFRVQTVGSGRIETARGARIAWGRAPAQFRLEGPQLVSGT